MREDSPDLQYVVTECSLEMSKPRVGAWGRVKKLVRCIVGRRSLVWKYGWQEESREAFVTSDSDWGGNSRDRRSTSGGVWMLGKHAI